MQPSGSTAAMKVLMPTHADSPHIINGEACTYSFHWTPHMQICRCSLDCIHMPALTLAINCIEAKGLSSLLTNLHEIPKHGAFPIWRHTVHAQVVKTSYTGI